MLMAFFSWWYSKGLAWKAEKILVSLERTMNTFSLGLLVKTWFAPFRQIDAVASGGSLDVRIRRSLDKLISRFIGALLRTSVMIIGGLFIIIKSIWGIFCLVCWLVMPILPVVFIAMFFSGWTPNIILVLKSGLQNINTPAKSSQQERKTKSNIFNFRGANQ